MHRWHLHREVYLEDELHVILHCGRYDRERGEFMQDLSQQMRLTQDAIVDARSKLNSFLQSTMSQDWEAFGKFAARIRQSRRRMRSEFHRRSARLLKHGHHSRKLRWSQSGRFVCRHGTFFQATNRSFQCPCMSAAPSNEGAWQYARMMPAIDPDLRQIIAVPFNAASWQKVRILQNRLRDLDGV